MGDNETNEQVIITILYQQKSQQHKFIDSNAQKRIPSDNMT